MQLLWRKIGASCVLKIWMEAGGIVCFFFEISNVQILTMINGHPIAISSRPILNEHQSTTLSSFFCSLLQLKIFSRKKMSTIFFLYFFQNLHGDCSHGRHGRIPIHRPKSYHQDSTSLEKQTRNYTYNI